MEEVLCKASTTDVQNVVLNLNIDKEVCLDTTALIPSQHFSNEVEGNVDLTKEALLGVCELSESGTKTPTLSETLSIPDSMLQKSSSPTLIESAIKVMKNLFSPEKVKNKSSSVLSPINKQRSASGSPSNSIYIPGKSDILSSEPGKEILNHVQIPMTENNLKIHLPPELGGIPSPLNIENHNNTDESFLTTVSLIDDSFHSAVTHLDENADLLKNGGNILGCALNNSQNLDSDNSHNDTLENESYLDNTTLKIGSLSFQSENTENLNGTLDNNSEKVEKMNSKEKEGKRGKGDVEHQSHASNGKVEKKYSETDLLIEVFGKESATDEHLGKAISTTTVILEKFREKNPEEPSAVGRPSLQEKKCASEGNSPNCKPNSSKIKLNKSDETLNHQVFSEGEKVIDKSSADSSWKKKSEASKTSNQPGANQTFDNLQPDSSLNNHGPVPVISQQSYTILNHDNKLKRPVIDANSEKQSFQEEKVSTECLKNVETNNENTSFSGEESLKSPQLKQSTPLWEGNSDGVQKFFRPTVLKLYSPEMENSAVGKQLEQALSHSTIKTYSLGKVPVEISPVDSINDLKCLYINKLSSSCVNSEKESLTFGTDSRSVILSAVGLDLKSEGNLKNVEDGSILHQYCHPLDVTFDKKEHQAHTQINAESPNNHRDFNQTYDKNPVSGKDLTFIKKRESGGTENQTSEISASSELVLLNETYSKPQLNETYNKNLDLATHLLDRTSEIIAGNQTFTKEADQDNIQEHVKSITSRGDGKENGDIESGRSSVCSSDDFTIGGKSSYTSVLSPLPANDFESNEIENMDNLSKVSFNGNLELCSAPDVKLNISDSTLSDVVSVDSQAEEKLLNSLKNEKLRCDPDLVQLIQEQFSQNDIEKICSVVQDMPSLKLTKDIMRASEQFDKSFHGNLSDEEFKPSEIVLKPEKPADSLSPQSFDFLSSIRGKPTGRDLSRESLYVKFDPLVQPPANSLIDFSKEGEALPSIDASPPNPHNTSICEQLLTISPQKKPDAIVPPLTPLSSKDKKDSEEEKLEKLKELQNEIYFLKNLYSERERTNKAKMEDYESQITKLTGESCFLEDKLKESNEREKSLVKKVKEQNQSISQLTVIMEEYVTVISKLTTELETLKNESKKQIESLSMEKDSYMTHLQNTEAAFTDVHTKYEKSKKTIASLKANENLYRNTILEQAQKLEDYKARAREAQEKAMMEFQKIQDKLNETKSNHTQESARLKAQLRKTELKLEALQECLDQKIKENQQLTAICDELIEGKK